MNGLEAYGYDPINASGIAPVTCDEIGACVLALVVLFGVCAYVIKDLRK